MEHVAKKHPKEIKINVKDRSSFDPRQLESQSVLEFNMSLKQEHTLLTCSSTGGGESLAYSP